MALGNKTLDDLLKPISGRLEHGTIPEQLEKPVWQVKPQRYTDGLSHAELVDMFAAEADKIRVQVKRCSREGLVDAVASIVGAGVPESGEPCTVMCADDDRFAQSGLYEALKAQELVTDVAVWDASNEEKDISTALVATYGITYATAGIAETGTIVQPTNARCGRSVSLLPLAHIAIVDADTIKPTMLEVMQGLDAAREDGTKMPSQVCFISGPSATADIELVRVEGVHGPMYVSYIIVE